MRTYLLSAINHLRIAFRKDETRSKPQQRHVRIVQGLFSGLASRGVAILVAFISVPLTVRYLGAERYGAWVTISTAMAWIAIADFGLSNSLTNAVSEGFATERHDLAQEYVTAAFWSLSAIAALLALVFFLCWPHVPWYRVFNVQSVEARTEVGPAVAVAFAIFSLNLPFTIVSKIYGAYQEVAIANAWTAAGNIVGLIGLMVVTELKGGLVSLIVAVSGSVLLVNMISAIHIFGKSKRWLLPWPGKLSWFAVRRLSSLGGMFFVIQIAALVLFQTDNLIIAHYLGAAAVTPYSVTWRLFTYTMLFQILASPSYWPAYAEAFTRGDRAWVRSSFDVNLRITIGSTVALALPLVLFGRVIIQKWAGPAAVPPTTLLVWMAVWSVIYAATLSQSCLLASASRLRGQMIYSISGAAVNFVASILLVQKIGVSGAILGTIIGYVTCVLVPQTIEVKRAIQIAAPIFVSVHRVEINNGPGDQGLA